MEVANGRDASDKALRLLGDQNLELTDNIFNQRPDIEKRWNDRFPVEGRSWAEGYIDGRLWVTLQGKWSIGTDRYKWFCRIVTGPAVPVSTSPDVGIQARDISDGDGGDDKVVFVVVVDPVKGPQRVVSRIDGPYLVEDKFFGAMQGSLHVRNSYSHSFVAYEIIPIFADGEMRCSGRALRSNDAGGNVIQCAPKVVNCITNHERKEFWDWFQRLVCEIKSGRLHVGRDNVGFDPKIKPVLGDRLGFSDNLINVYAGPFGFEPRTPKNFRGYFRSMHV